jgi:SAM-dependent methyltransferase
VKGRTPRPSDDRAASPRRKKVPQRAAKKVPLRAAQKRPVQPPGSVEPDAPKIEIAYDEGPKRRRALSHVGGPVEELEGPKELTSLIERALSINADAGVRDHVHGFQSYPARLHPGTAARLIEALAPPGSLVCDAFCGSGTVLVEARRLGRQALGIDLNPLAVQLSLLKTQPPSAEEREALFAAADRVAEHAEERRASAAGPSRPYSAAERKEFEIHVLLELDGLAQGIQEEANAKERRTLMLVLSSLFGKLARPDPERVDPEAPPKRLASGFAIRFFLDRLEELNRQWEEYERLLPVPPPAVQCIEADARDFVGKWQRFGSRARAARRAQAKGSSVTGPVQAVISSPPYPGVLDYADYHASRLRWLGLPNEAFLRQEMGSRRLLGGLTFEQAARRCEGDLVRVFRELGRVTADDARIVIVVADSMLAGQPYFANDMLDRCASAGGLELLAKGSQRRPHFHYQSAQAFGRRPRYEHLVILGKATTPARAQSNTRGGA